MKTDKIIDRILENSSVSKELSEEEIIYLKISLETDFNQYLMDTLFAILTAKEIEKVDILMQNQDEVGIAEILAVVSQDEDVSKGVEEAIDTYIEDMTKDLKKIKELVRKGKQRMNKKK